MVIGSLGRMRNRLLSALRAMPVLAARMQKAVILGIQCVEVPVLYAIKQPRSHSFKPYKTAVAAGKRLGYLFRARKFFSLSNLLTLYKAQVRPNLEYCSHICRAAAPPTLSILDAIQRKAIRLIGDPALTCHLQPLSHRRAVGDLHNSVALQAC
nr:unnamed protein product [Callosobruchus chinensis]